MFKYTLIKAGLNIVLSQHTDNTSINCLRQRITQWFVISKFPHECCLSFCLWWIIVMLKLIEAEWCIYASLINPSLDQIMACRMVGVKPLSEPMWNMVNWTLWNKLQWIYNRNSYFFIQENKLEHVVCKTASIPSRPQCINSQSAVIFLDIATSIINDAT